MLRYQSVWARERRQGRWTRSGERGRGDVAGGRKVHGACALFTSLTARCASSMLPIVRWYENATRARLVGPSTCDASGSTHAHAGVSTQRDRFCGTKLAPRTCSMPTKSRMTHVARRDDSLECFSKCSCDASPCSPPPLFVSVLTKYR